MPEILQDLPIAVSPAAVYEAVSTSQGLDRWWTKTSSGTAGVGQVFDLGFGEEFAWRAKVVTADPESAFVLEFIEADEDWMGSQVASILQEIEGGTRLRFQYSGWSEVNDHYRTTSHCWALYLRILRRYLEFGESVPYEDRLDA